ncbi:MAG: hypothetical protein KKB25_01915 [Nanoarchaeota archaeon]|nr:hypothetical protein [Nanoarchaeota archaeon]
MEIRIKFSKKEAERFFSEFRKHLECKTFKELSAKLSIPYGRLQLHMHSKRTIPISLIEKWKSEFRFDYRKFRFRKIDMDEFNKKCGYKAAKLMRRKYGNKWNVILGKRGRRSLQKRLINEPLLNKKWRESIVASLKQKYGENAYSLMGNKGGKASIKKQGKKVVLERLAKMFPKSINKRFEFNGKYFRSVKEIEVASLLEREKIKYVYEPHIIGFFPDFMIGNKTLIEVVGFEWKPHIERTVNKIKKLKSNGYNVIVYTYPNMIKYFEKLDIPIFTDSDDFIKEVGYIRE